jgi:hypothetical protein
MNFFNRVPADSSDDPSRNDNGQQQKCRPWLFDYVSHLGFGLYSKLYNLI